MPSHGQVSLRDIEDMLDDCAPGAVIVQDLSRPAPREARCPQESRNRSRAREADGPLLRDPALRPEQDPSLGLVLRELGATAVEPIPLSTDANGVIRVAGTRVTLDTVIDTFMTGASSRGDRTGLPGASARRRLCGHHLLPAAPALGGAIGREPRGASFLSRRPSALAGGTLPPGGGLLPCRGGPLPSRGESSPRTGGPLSLRGESPPFQGGSSRPTRPAPRSAPRSSPTRP